ncbi:uncharacterized protein LOC108139160 [Drosophila elegans]|uniref:uncharacterized protein LOC108139160 n=1 Tax=Drosophila elegans TaxID=30023 RepID=UPI0007E85B57|nr:uncharacterized protein LOC108139160 [Drosophila elegans]
MSIIWLCLFWICLNSVQAVYVPENTCTDYFQYASDINGKSYAGIFKAPISRRQRFEWSATFVVHGHHGVFVSSLMPYPNKDDSVLDLLSGQPNRVYVYFVNIKNELPKLTLLSLNQMTLCNNTGYGIPSTKITVQYIMDQTKN